MLTTILRGGLGNQLFQIFALMAYSIRHRIPFVLPYKTFVKSNRQKTYWDTLLVRLKHYTNHNWLITDTQLSNFQEYKGSHGYTEIPCFEGAEIRGGICFDGYFQSWQYFVKEYSRIYEWLDMDTMKTRVPMIPADGRPSISLHFRVGDYANIRCYHPVLTAEYYTRAIRHILNSLRGQNRVHDSRIYVFYEESDRELIETTVSQIRTALGEDSSTKSLEFIFVDTGLTDWQHLLMMSQCDHHVIANSTFSWWGAVLSRNTFDVPNDRLKKIVCYPSVWYGHQLYYIPVRDLFPSYWVQINADSPDIRKWCKCFQY